MQIRNRLSHHEWEWQGQGENAVFQMELSR